MHIFKLDLTSDFCHNLKGSNFEFKNCFKEAKPFYISMNLFIFKTSVAYFFFNQPQQTL